MFFFENIFDVNSSFVRTQKYSRFRLRLRRRRRQKIRSEVDETNNHRKTDFTKDAKKKFREIATPAKKIINEIKNFAFQLHLRWLRGGFDKHLEVRLCSAEPLKAFFSILMGNSLPITLLNCFSLTPMQTLVWKAKIIKVSSFKIFWCPTLWNKFRWKYYEVIYYKF